MIKFLTILLGFIAEIFNAWRIANWKQEGRQEAIKEANDALNHDIEQAEAAVVVADPERDERLRNRFDRSRIGE